ncbi:MAG: cytidine deaminase [Nitrospirae bacterium]|nr:cytidine deaminase [Nitrospirota bacterium]
MFIKRLVREAEKSMKLAITPYSDFKVGASIATKREKIYTGCNIENPSLMLSICAEKVALLKALSDGERSFKAIAIVSNKQDYCYPCGSCRQILWEFARDIDVYLAGSAGVKKYSMREILPYAFNKVSF